MTVIRTFLLAALLSLLAAESQAQSKDDLKALVKGTGLVVRDADKLIVGTDDDWVKDKAWDKEVVTKVATWSGGLDPEMRIQLEDKEGKLCIKRIWVVTKDDAVWKDDGKTAMEKVAQVWNGKEFQGMARTGIVEQMRRAFHAEFTEKKKK